MMGVHFDITFGLDVQIEQAVAAECIEHMIEKGNARVDVGFARPINIERKRNIGFLGGAGKLRNTFFLSHR